MAVTQGHGNPDWARDEVLLALDLYFALDGKVPGPTDQRVIDLSDVLRSLPIHAAASKNARFRNPDGVVFKLQNLRQVATGQGLGNVSATDKAVWADFGSDPRLVSKLAELIRAQAGGVEVAPGEVEASTDDEEFVEGRLLTALHKRRERDRRVRSRLLKERHARAPLRCDACNEGPKVTEERLQDAGFEGHHLLPLGHSGERKVRVKDMALLCATCHRLIHRAMSLEKRWVGLAEIRKLLHGGHGI